MLCVRFAVSLFRCVSFEFSESLCWFLYAYRLESYLFYLPHWTELSRKYLGKDKSVFRKGGGGWCKTAPMTWRCHTQRCNDVVFWTVKTTLKSDYLLKIKAWEKNNQKLHSGRDKGIQSSCPWFATPTTRQASSWIANHPSGNVVIDSINLASFTISLTQVMTTRTLYLITSMSLSLTGTPSTAKWRGASSYSWEEDSHWQTLVRYINIYIASIPTSRTMFW